MGEIVSWLVVLGSFGNGNKIAAVEGKNLSGCWLADESSQKANLPLPGTNHI